VAGSYELSALAPLTDLDKQALLATDTVEQRLTLLVAMLVDHEIGLLQELELD
jgi:Lon protease-like protein